MVPSSPEARPKRHPASVVRAAANVVTLVTALLFLMALAFHFPPWIIARIGLATIVAFIVGFVAILVENRTARGTGHNDGDKPGQGGTP